MTTWEQENKIEQKKEPEIPRCSLTDVGKQETMPGNVYLPLSCVTEQSYIDD